MLATPRRRSAGLPFAANGVLYGTWAARIPEIQEQAGLGEAELGLALLGAAVGLIVSASATGALAERFGARRLTLAALVLFGAAVVAPGLAVGLWSLAAGLALVGLTSGLMDVAMNAWAAEVEAAEEATILGACHGLFSLGAMVGAGLGALAAWAALPLALHFAASGVVFAGGAVVQGWGVDDLPASDEAEVQEDAPLFALPGGAMTGLAGLAFCGLIVEGGIADWSAVFARDALGASPATAPLGFAAFSACMAAARFGSDGVADRLGGRRLVGLGAGVAVVGLALCVAASHVAVATLGFGIAGLGLAGVVPSLFRAASQAGGSRGIAAVTSVGYVGFLAGPPALGFVAEAVGLRASFGLLVALAAIVALGAAGAFARAERG